jgi:hypothetical protein
MQVRVEFLYSWEWPRNFHRYNLAKPAIKPRQSLGPPLPGSGALSSISVSERYPKPKLWNSAPIEGATVSKAPSGRNALSQALAQSAKSGATVPFRHVGCSTDQDEILFATARPVILNGIEDIVPRADLADLPTAPSS